MDVAPSEYSSMPDAKPAAQLELRRKGQSSSTQSPAPASQSEDCNESSDDKKDHKDHHCENSRGGSHGCSTWCMWFIASPFWKCIVFLIIAFVPVFGVLLALPRLLEKQRCESVGCQFRHWMLSLWLATQFVYNFVMTQWTDPGGTRGHKPPHETTGQYEMRIGPNADDVILFAPNYCEKCKTWKPPRSHHCSFTKRCVLRMDHYCPFTGNCIGMRNHGHFILMYMFAMVGLSYSLFMCTYVVISESYRVDTGFLQNVTAASGAVGLAKNVPLLSPGLAGMMTHFSLKVMILCGIEIGAQTIGSVIAFVAVLSFGCPALCMAFQGKTIIEVQFPMKEYVQIKPNVYCPLGPGFYSLKWYENVKALLGKQWWLRVLLPTNGGGVDLTPAISPIPSQSGADCLRERIAQVNKDGVERTVTSCEDLGFNPGPAAEPPGGTV